MLRRVIEHLNICLVLLALLVVPANAVGPRPPDLSASNSSRILIKTAERKLYFYDSTNNVRVFVIAVGREGRKWSGETKVTRKVLKPKWAPPPEILKDNPNLPAIVPPGPNNPLGAAVLVLGDGTYGIHGNNNASLIGTDASYGCFRMYNADILALFDMVRIGTKVYVQR